MQSLLHVDPTRPRVDTPTTTLPPPKKPLLPSPSPTSHHIPPYKGTHHTKTPKLITSHTEADNAVHHALRSRLELLPTVKQHKTKIGTYDKQPNSTLCQPQPQTPEKDPSTTPTQSTTKKGLMWPRGPALSHPAAPLLTSYAIDGCPVDCGPDWSYERLIAALTYGAHPSATKPDARECLITETAEKIEKGFARLVTWKSIKNNIPTKLKLSPVAMIPHKSRAFRCILDLSFQLRSQQHGKEPSVNKNTTKLAPAEAMRQLGSALKRIITKVAEGQQEKKEFKFAKLDIKDGFWRLIVNNDDAWNFCYCIPPENPNTPLDDIQIVVPNSLQMGWCESPPFFCAASETARDVIESLLQTELPAHPFEQRMLPENFTSLPIGDLTSTTALIEVFVDDFIGCVDDITQTKLLQTTRAMLHGINSISPPPPSVTGHNGGDPISEKKLDKLEGLWSHVKEILGWIINGTNYTIYLPSKKVEKIKIKLRRLLKRRSMSIKEFQEIAGTLHHASMGIPGSRGLFTALWAELRTAKQGFIHINKSLQQTLQDFQWLFREIANKPINVAQIVPATPQIHGYTDACKYAAGGVWLITLSDGSLRCVVWTYTFPLEIVKLLEDGIISINDLEMAGILLGWLVLEHLLPSLTFIPTGIQCDNSSSVAWSTKFTARSLVAGHLLRALALRQQICKSAPLLVIPIAGHDNTMADVASRFSSDPSLQQSSPTLLKFFNSHFPQKNSWEEFHLRPKLGSLVMSSLQGTRSTLESWRRLPGLAKNIGKNGAVMQQGSRWTRFSKTQTPSSEISSSQPSLLGSGQASTASANKLKYKASLTHLLPSARPLNWQVSAVPSTERPTNTTSPSNAA